ncbi:hypothetical protein [Mycobacteroides abscessus]|uniref:hypothetical protein n=1 Tax=Mycobacteroides abscessus TaxID=36809 RepID=UPI0009A6C847|nr:hypothetical protein [Mycobacteroides abscessus]SKO14294.1 Uncharacterised protein [Mycobacteroides abscessus subsp. bolletii]SKX37832.1 Uncharacterised protein [Mycobacteroides abscessus subsp. bolletii]
MSKNDLSSGIGQVHLYTMRELNQDTAGTIAQINQSGIPGVITRHGRFVAVIYPLADTPIESYAVARALEDVETRNQLIGEATVTSISTAQAAADELDVNVDVSRADRELKRPRTGR